jgi:hypothetical protein
MKIKTSELTGVALDWAVANAIPTPLNTTIENNTDTGSNNDRDDREIHVVIRASDKAQGSFMVSRLQNDPKIVWDKATSAPTESVQFTLMEDGQKSEELNIDGQSWRALESDTLEADFYARVLTGTSLARSIKQACVFHEHNDFDATSTAAALQVALHAIDAGLIFARPDLLTCDAANAANARLRRSGGTEAYFNGVKATLEEAARVNGQTSADLSRLSSFLRAEGFEVGHHDSETKDVEAAVRYLVQRLDEYDEREDAAASHKAAPQG